MFLPFYKQQTITKKSQKRYWIFLNLVLRAKASAKSTGQRVKSLKHLRAKQNLVWSAPDILQAQLLYVCIFFCWSGQLEATGAEMQI